MAEPSWLNDPKVDEAAEGKEEAPGSAGLDGPGVGFPGLLVGGTPLTWGANIASIARLKVSIVFNGTLNGSTSESVPWKLNNLL